MAGRLLARLPDHLEAHLLVAWVEERAGRAKSAERVFRALAGEFPQAYVPALRQPELLARNDQPARARPPQHG